MSIASYQWFTRPGVVLVVDNDAGGRSVTNDIENVCAALVRNGVLRPGLRLVYCDSDGVWDEVRLDARCNFAGFLPLGARSIDEVLEMLRR